MKDNVQLSPDDQSLEDLPQKELLEPFDEGTSSTTGLQAVTAKMDEILEKITTDNEQLAIR